MNIQGTLLEHKLAVRIGGAAVGCYIVIQGIMSHKYYLSLIGIAIIIASFYSRRYVINEKGVDNVGMLMGVKLHNLWTWEEMTSFVTDYRKAAPQVKVTFGRDVVMRTYYVTYEESQALLELAKQYPDIYIDDLTPEKEAELAANAKRTQERMRAEQAKKKEAKRKKKKRH